MSWPNIIRGGIKDPRISPLTSVVAVEVAPDLKTCKAYISVLGDSEAQKATLAGLKSAEGYIRRELAHTVNLRNTRRFALFWISPSSTVCICQRSSMRSLQRMRKMFDLDQEIKGAKRIGTAGHIRPDGDCVGSCLGLGLYLRENYPELEAVDIHLGIRAGEIPGAGGNRDHLYLLPGENLRCVLFSGLRRYRTAGKCLQNILRPREK